MSKQHVEISFYIDHEVKQESDAPAAVKSAAAPAPSAAKSAPTPSAAKSAPTPSAAKSAPTAKSAAKSAPTAKSAAAPAAAKEKRAGAKLGVVLMKKPKSEREPSPEAHPGQREDKIIGEAIQSATRAQESLAGLLQCFDQCAAHIRSEVATMRIAIDDLNGQRKRRSLQGPL
jgi:hypothetical protein